MRVGNASGAQLAAPSEVPTLPDAEQRAHGPAIMSVKAAMSLLAVLVLAATACVVSAESFVPRGRALSQDDAPDTADVVYQLVSLPWRVRQQLMHSCAAFGAR